MDLRSLQEHLDSRLDRIEGKLDDHIARISRSEEAIAWLRGHAKIVTTLVLAVAGFFAVAYFESFPK